MSKNRIPMPRYITVCIPISASRTGVIGAPTRRKTSRALSVSIVPQVDMCRSS